jgi:hypothetical protein
MSPLAATATLADGTSAARAFGCRFMTMYTTMPTKTENVIAAATIKEVRFCIVQMHLYMKLELLGSWRQGTFSAGE